MPYKNSLYMVQKVFRKCRIHTQIWEANEPADESADLGFGILFGQEAEYRMRIRELLSVEQNNTIYSVSHPLGYRQLLVPLPREQVLTVGPFAYRQTTPQEIWEYAERAGLSPRQAKRLEEYMSNLPYLADQSHLYAVLDTFAEELWGGGNYISVELLQENDPVLTVPDNGIPEDDRAWNIRMMERRYEYENELMQAVSNGQIHKVEMLLASLRDQPFEQRLSDPVRNTKNYCIIMNTLLRKAAERGGVHPIHLNSVSSDFARQIEQLSATTPATELMTAIFRRYCLLVRDHVTGQYSEPIRRTVAHIESDLTADLGLRTLARLQNINPSYLSSLFHKETGKTLTDFVNERRIRSAKHLLRSTGLQIQTVAQHCGILDVNYFSKLFKKHVGMTPREYRETVK